MAEESPEHGPTDQGDGDRPTSPRRSPTTNTCTLPSPHPAVPAAGQGALHAGRSRMTARQRREPRLCDVAAQPVDAGRRQRDQPAVLRPGLDVAEPVRQPNPAPAVDTASVWFTAYPLSLITRPDESFLTAMADEEMWKAFAEIGIEAIHTGPVKRAGGISGWQYTPSVDGHFDRISTQIDPAFGTEEEFRAMCATANWYGGTIIDDIVPGHTGKGADFRLAEMKYADYPGIYHMVEIDPEDWDRAARRPGGRGLGQHRRRHRGMAGQGRLHHRPPAAGDLLRRGRQGDQLERHPPGRRHRRRRAALGVPALLQGGPAVDQLAGPVVRRHADGHRRRAAFADRPRLRRPAAGRQRIPRRREERRGQPRLVGGPPAVRGGQPPHRAAWSARSAASPSRS